MENNAGKNPELVFIFNFCSHECFKLRKLKVMSKKRFIQPEDVETQVFEWGTIKWMSTPKHNEAERFTTGVVLLEPGKGHTRHNHPGVEEILYVVSGEGEQMVEVPDGNSGMKEERRPIKSGMLIHIPADVFHETINTSWESLKLIAIYAPSGPEELLREMADQILPAGGLPERS